MGYYSSPATAFLMTLFNVRLGAWLPNPARAESLGRSISCVRPQELVPRDAERTPRRQPTTAAATSTSPTAAISRIWGFTRWCGGAAATSWSAMPASDPDCTFTDLGNAVRKVKIDLDIDIAFSELHIAGRDEPLPAPLIQLAWALGESLIPTRTKMETC